jgi:hypothetical protein
MVTISALKLSDKVETSVTNIGRMGSAVVDLIIPVSYRLPHPDRGVTLFDR